MDSQTIKQRILSGDMSDEELSALIKSRVESHPRKQSGGFLKTILKGFIDAYTAPSMWRLALEASLIFIVICGIIFLSYADKIDAMITSVLLSFVLGFLFGKIK